MLIQTFKDKLIPTHIFAITYNIFINMIGTDRIFTTINLSSPLNTADALYPAKILRKAPRLAQYAALKELALQLQLVGQFWLSEFQTARLLFGLFVLLLLFIFSLFLFS